MKLRFVEGGALDSKIIRYTTRCRWSHVEAISGDGTFGSMLNGGVRWRDEGKDYPNMVDGETVEILATPPAESAFWAFLLNQEGKPYDWRAILGFGLGERDWRQDDSWFCSELIARALEVCGIIDLPVDVPVWRITPRDVWLLVAEHRP